MRPTYIPPKHCVISLQPKLNDSCLLALVQLVASFVDKAYCKGWGTIYVTDDLFFEGGNPWDDPPSFWNEMVAASTNIPTVESCGLDGIKVLAPLFGSDPAGKFVDENIRLLPHCILHDSVSTELGLTNGKMSPLVSVDGIILQ